MGAPAVTSKLPLDWPLVSRIAASLLGGYAFVWGFTMLAIVLGVVAGMPYLEAQTLAYLFAFLAYLAGFLWAFSCATATRAWAVLAGGGALMTGAAWLIGGSLR